MNKKSKRQVANYVGRAIVGVAGAWVVAKVIKPQAAIVGGLVILGIHEAFDRPVSNAIYRAL